MLTVQYIGPDAAILGGSYIYEGETRSNVTPAQLRAARQFHPDGFAIVDGELPEIAPEPEPDPPIIQPPTTDDEPPTTDQPEPTIDDPIAHDPAPIAEEPAVETEAAIVSLDEPAPAPAPRRAPGRHGR